MILEKLKTGEGEVQTLYRMASMAGIPIIKVVSVRSVRSAFSIVGFDVPVPIEFTNPEDIGQNIDIQTTSGSLWIYPDEQEIGWGYVFGTEDNKRRLASQLRFGRIRIADASFLDEIKRIATQNGWPISILEKPQMGVRVSPREAALANEKKMQDNTITALREMVARQQAQIEALMKHSPKVDERAEDLSFASSDVVTEIPDEIPDGDIFGEPSKVESPVKTDAPTRGGFRGAKRKD